MAGKPECPRCNGVGKVRTDPMYTCNCGTGEGCTAHDEAAVSLWGDTCPLCYGTGVKASREAPHGG